jgi:hypothetical protein
MGGGDVLVDSIWWFLVILKVLITGGGRYPGDLELVEWWSCLRLDVEFLVDGAG